MIKSKKKKNVTLNYALTLHVKAHVLVGTCYKPIQLYLFIHKSGNTE